MAARTAKQTKDRVEIADAVDENLPEDDLWNDLITENPAPPFKIKGIVIPQPTKKQVDEWSKAVTANKDDADKLLMSDDAYEQLKVLFDNLPVSAWRAFQKKFMNHVFGLDDSDSLGK